MKDKMKNSKAKLDKHCESTLWITVIIIVII